MENTLLCPTLRPIFELEIARGNEVESTESGWTNCVFSVVMKNRLCHDSVEKFKLPYSVRKWKNTDGHYALETGYLGDKYKHSIAGPTD
ncbi:MAG: hypothetical protein CL601_01180 [Alteromonas sp.]|jgi:hypothetical protein|uniref:Uncharacterized protein n=1 Tax=Alteromonas macleodii (strain English Channel 673) TaxID=1004788 RepID=A0AB32ZUV9_ALTME|nr:hypothetical protein AMEC673_02880 [Alteromonas macleodii str. 'English Channel 673']MAW02341.1 hypothetical protein [Alteromonas sp.]MBS08738.1 hypothetical protein [Alteromonas sp.]HCY27376.1 hypothetical protein [Alteromonas macleodii]|tara:strand:- start:614 stop:880 length:267 start_codon:yes stop_codon:yes gene_type:complete